MTDRDVTVSLRAQVSGFVAGIKAAQTQFKGFNDDLEKSYKKRRALEELGNAAGIMGAAAAAGFGLMVKSAADFDKAMSNVEATGDDAKKNLDALREAAIQAGADTAFSATEAAAGIENLLKAGVKSKDVLAGGLSGALDLAAAGQIDVAEAAELSATALSQFNLEGKDVPHVADLLAAAAGKAQGEVTDMGMALKQGGLVASQMGVSIEETTGTLAAFANAGLLGSDAGTSFKQMLLQLANPSGKANELMDDLGISAYNAKGNFIGIAAVAGQLRDKLGDLTQQQRDSALATIFGSDAVRAANVLYKEGAKGIDNWTKQVNDQGYAAETAATKMDNLSGDLEQLKGSLETALIGTGEGAQGPLRDLVQLLTKLVNAYNELPAPVKDATGALTLFAGILGGGIFVGTRILSGIASAKENFSDLGLTMRSTEGRSRALKASLRGLSGAAGIGALTLALHESNSELAFFEGAIGGALTGAAFGPQGLVIGAAAGALGILAKNLLSSGNAAEEAEQDIASYKSTLNELTGATTRATRAMVAQQFQEDGVLEKAAQLKISTHDLVLAAVGHEDAQRRVNAQLAAAKRRLAEMEDRLLAAGNGTAIVNAKTASLRDAIGRTEDALKSESGQIQASIRDNRELQKAIDGTSKDVTELQKVYDKTPKQVATMLLAEGIEKAIGGTEKFRDKVNSIMDSIRDEDVDIKLSASAAKTAAKIANVAESFHAEGGRIRGPGTGTSDSVRGWLSDGEFVVRERVAKQIYPFLTALNAGNAEAMEAAGARTKKGLIRFAQGGMVVAGTNAMTTSMNTSTAITGIKNYAHAYEASLDAFGDKLGEALSKALNQMLAFGGNGMPLGPNGTLSLGQIMAGQSFAKSQTGKPYIWGGVGPSGYDCSGFQSAVLNSAFGQYPYSRRGSTGTMPWSGSRPGVGRYTIGWFTGDPGHTSGNIGGLGVESRGGDGVVLGSGATSPLSSMFNGVMHYDRGGLLPPGVTIAVNGTGRNERVSKSDQARPIIVHGTFQLDGREITGVMRGIAREEIEDENHYQSGGM